MKMPNPILLNTLYAAGAYPFDDIEDDDLKAVLSVWVIPTEPIPIQIGIKGNGASVKSFAAELSRLANVFRLRHNFPQKTQGKSWAYQIIFQCEGAISRVISRTLIQLEPEEIDAMLTIWPFIPWFNPSEKYTDVYKRGFLRGLLLPDTSALVSGETDLPEIAEWDGNPELQAGAIDESAFEAALSRGDSLNDFSGYEDEDEAPDLSELIEDEGDDGLASFQKALAALDEGDEYDEEDEEDDEDGEDDEDEEDDDDSGD